MTAEPTLLDAIAEAEAERDRAFTNLDASDQRDELTLILDTIVRVADRGAVFSANDVRPLLPEGVNTNRVGRAYARAIELGLIEVHGFTKSTDKGTHGKRVLTYRRAAA
jgi:hypothetical protein